MAAWSRQSGGQSMMCMAQKDQRTVYCRAGVGKNVHIRLESVRLLWYLMGEVIDMTLTELRKNIYTVVAEVLKTGRTIEIHSRGRTILLSPGGGDSKLDRLRKAARRKALVGKPEDIIHMNWDMEWHPRHI